MSSITDSNMALLRKREKELECIYSISDLFDMHIPLKSLLKGIVRRIPSACSHSELAAARITLDDEVYQTPEYEDTPWMMSIDIFVHGKVRGCLDVVYIEERPPLDVGPFLNEEKKLMDVIVSRLGKVLERRHVEEALLDSEKRYRVIFESSPLGIFIDRNGIITHCNRSFLKIFGLSREDVIGSEVTDFVNDEKLEKVLFRSDQEIMPYYETEYTARLAGRQVHLRSYYVPHRSSRTTLEGGVCLIADITRNKQSEDALHQQKELLTSTFNALQDLIVVVDKELNVVTSNWKSDELISPEKRKVHPHCYECFMHRDEPCDPCHVKDVFSTGEVAENEYTSPVDGKTREYRVSPVFGKNNDIVMAVEHIRDITERKQTETALQQSTEELASAYEELRSLDRLKDEFLSNLRHELNTPLTTIRGYSELLQEGTFGPLNPEQENAVDKVVNKSKRLHSLLDSLLFASSSQGGRVKYNFEKMLLSDSLQSAIGEVSRNAKDKSISLNFDQPPEVLLTKADADYLPRVFVNLIDNAIKFTPREGKINLSAFRENGDVHAVIEDNGIGIAEENLPKLFQKFYQIDSSSTRNYGGNGLGLYISKVIVEDHGGKIWIESEEGAGTRVHVTLPAIDQN
ncbi:PAS domain S-box protein [Methanolobus zinderi]|uniref:histidine kinase n=2 Tax=Methanolobus zinderi TaxID=536044 RepID=A0A7D5I922_9EURY|nr:PAS domain S-box protein [Methanolobus zinderi]